MTATLSRLVVDTRQRREPPIELLAQCAGMRIDELHELESGREPLTDELTDRLLTPMGERLAYDLQGEPIAKAIAHPYDADQIARLARKPIGLRLEQALAFNDLAAELSAGQRVPAPPQRQ